MAYFKSRGLRGSAFEDMINTTNDKYKEHGLACIQKVPTPIKVTKIDNEKRLITEGYFEKKSSVDYIGVVQGYSVCFDAKETSINNLPIANIHEHQIEYMRSFIKQKGIAFLLVHFKHVDEMFFLPCEVIFSYYEKSKQGGMKNIPYSAFEQEYRVYRKGNYLVHYLEAISKYLERGMNE